MRHVSTYEYELLKKKLERIEQTLLSDTCDDIVIQHFNLQEIQTIRQNLETIYRNYNKQLSGLEDLISQYHNLHIATADKLRVRFRILNKNLENNATSRALLGLPPYQPRKSVKTPSLD